MNDQNSTGTRFTAGTIIAHGNVRFGSQEFAMTGTLRIAGSAPTSITGAVRLATSAFPTAPVYRGRLAIDSDVSVVPGTRLEVLQVGDFEINGTLRVNGATLETLGARHLFNGTIEFQNNGRGFLVAQPPPGEPGLWDFTGTWILGQGTHLTLGVVGDPTMPAQRVRNSGVLDIRSGSINAPELPKLSTNTGTLRLSGDATLSLTQSLVSTGTVRVEAGSRLDIAGGLSQTGGLLHLAGQMSATGGVQLRGATLEGSGTVTGGLSLATVGARSTVSPGLAVGQIGMLTVAGDVDAIDAVFVFNLSRTTAVSADLLSATNIDVAASLLSLSLADGSGALQEGDRFLLLHADNALVIAGLTLQPDGSLGGYSIVLEQVGNELFAVVIPEPAVVWWLAGGVGVALLLARRRQRVVR